jgi:hypothetical protein
VLIAVKKGCTGKKWHLRVVGSAWTSIGKKMKADGTIEKVTRGLHGLSRPQRWGIAGWQSRLVNDMSLGKIKRRG